MRNPPPLDRVTATPDGRGFLVFLIFVVLVDIAYLIPVIDLQILSES